MPTQEQINAANVELQIANDNYAALANKYNRYQEAFKTYANATPEQQERARWAMQNLLNSYNQLRLDMYAAEDRINQAQNAVNNLNTYVVPQSPSRGGGQRRRQVVVPEVVVGPIETPQEVINMQNRLPQNGVVQMSTSYSPSWINSQPTTISSAGSRYPTPQTIAEKQGTRDSRRNQYTPASSQYHIWYYTPDTIPAEIQRVRQLRWNDYLQGMNDLEKYRGYTVVGQNAYKNWNRYNLN